MPPRNPTPLTAAQQALAADPRWLEIARKVAARAARARPALAAEFESAAALAIVQAARTFDPGLGHGFGTHLHRRLDGAILDVEKAERLRGYRRPVRAGGAPAVVSLDAEPSSADDGGRPGTYAESIAADELPVGWEVESLDEVEAMVRWLPPGWAEPVRLYYTRCETATLRRVGLAIGRNESRAYQIVSEAHGWLREGKIA